MRNKLTQAFYQLQSASPSIKNLEEDLDQISSDVVNLDKFTRTAKSLFQKILTLHDAVNDSFELSWILVRLEANEFWKCPIGKQRKQKKKKLLKTLNEKTKKKKKRIPTFAFE